MGKIICFDTYLYEEGVYRVILSGRGASRRLFLGGFTGRGQASPRAALLPFPPELLLVGLVHRELIFFFSSANAVLLCVRLFPPGVLSEHKNVAFPPGVMSNFVQKLGLPPGYTSLRDTIVEK